MYQLYFLGAGSWLKLKFKRLWRLKMEPRTLTKGGAEAQNVALAGT
jgi:hypothetical protein